MYPAFYSLIVNCGCAWNDPALVHDRSKDCLNTNHHLPSPGSKLLLTSNITTRTKQLSQLMDGLFISPPDTPAKMPSNVSPNPNPTSDTPSPDPAATALPPSPTAPTTTTTTTPAAPTYQHTGPVIVTSTPVPPTPRTRRPSAASIALATPGPTPRSVPASSIPAHLDRKTYVTAYKHGFALAISAVMDVLDEMKEEEASGFLGMIEEAKKALEELQSGADMLWEEEVVGDRGI
ncbi:hypothetical protein P167DRAFT_25204 [Morchella conica CCBAS932]|uniref:Uncharacterized protein n=1 Tax=Morchella conica CCBAS932 TaxID=1392247 RepID=A0A3N4K8L8_9PEZI|nr:hypothetical protein P167DRAFT_25204 [Morchella conica CCBAS932]